MPVVDFGEKISTGSRSFVRLKETGSSLQFRLLGAAVAEGNHFFQTDEGWDIVGCNRINSGEQCDHCSALFKMIDSIPADVKKDKEAFSKERNRIRNSNRPLVVSITYNFPIIDRESHQFAVFQATPGMRTKIEAEHSLGIKVLEVDFKAKNTGLTGKDKYAITRVDSADTEPLSTEEQKIVDEFDMESFVERIEGKRDEMAEEDSSLDF